MKKEKYQIRKEPGARPEPHEIKTAKVLVEQGDVLFLRPINREGQYTPDILWRGEKWEIKAPKGQGNTLLEHKLRDALHQSNNIVIDLRRININQTKCLFELEKQFLLLKKIKKLVIVKRFKRGEEKTVDFSR